MVDVFRRHRRRIGSFCWYWYERLPDEAKEEHPSVVAAADQGAALLSDWGGVVNSGAVRPDRSVWPISTPRPRRTPRQ
jgi:hypothetical protein